MMEPRALLLLEPGRYIYSSSKNHFPKGLDLVTGSAPVFVFCGGNQHYLPAVVTLLTKKSHVCVFFGSPSGEFVKVQISEYLYLNHVATLQTADARVEGLEGPCDSVGQAVADVTTMSQFL
ncbi:unnamed protein product [Hapterophycus canaliculatus]